MKLIKQLHLFSAFLASASAIPFQPPSNISLGSNLPDPRFRIDSQIDAPLLPVDATLLNILYFMATVSIQNFNEELIPRTYSAPRYEQVEIASYGWTESRFLLWGIYLAVVDMVEHARFHNTRIDLYWEDRLVGRMKIAAKSVLSLPGSVGDDAAKLLDNGNQSDQTTSSQSDTRVRSPLTHALPVQTSRQDNATGSESAADDELVASWEGANSSAPASPTLLPLNPSLSNPAMRINFNQVAGASKISRNSVFLTFYSALLLIAQFRPDEEMRPFSSKSPLGDMYLHMFDCGSSCRYGRALNMMTYVPRYMAEHPAFGYHETSFNAKIRGFELCKGTLMKSMQS